MLKLGDLKGIVNVLTSLGKQHTPELLIGLGITGMAASTLLGVKAAPKASKKIEKAIEIKNEQLIDAAVEEQRTSYTPITKLGVGDTIKVCWKDFAPCVATGVAGAICIVGGTHINLRRNAALVTACKLSEMTIKDLQKYKNKVAEVIGEEKSDAIEAEVDKEHVEEVVKNTNIDSLVICGSGPILYFDKMGGQWFWSDKATVREAISKLNYTMTQDMYVSLNDYYDELNLRHTVAGRDLGWNIDGGLIEPRFSSQLTQDGLPYVVLTTRLEPRYNFGSLH